MMPPLFRITATTGNGGRSDPADWTSIDVLSVVGLSSWRRVSDPRITGPLSTFAVPIGDELHRPKPPFEQAFASASFGSFLFTLCIYTAVMRGHALSNIRPPPFGYGRAAPAPAPFWSGLAYVAVRAHRVTSCAHFFPVAGPVGTGWALSVLAGPEVFDNYYVHGFFTAWTVGGLVECFSLRGVSGDARRNA